MSELQQVPGIELAMDGAVATVTIALAHPKNAFRAEDATRLSALFHEATDAGARCLVLQGKATCFSAGWDVASMRPGIDDPVAVITDIVAPLCMQLRSLACPTIAAVTGPALGFGFGLAMCCDLAIAENDAIFGSPFGAIGMVPDSGTHFFLRKRLGPVLAAELIFTGRFLSGDEAAAMRLVNRSVPKGEASSQAAKLAAQIAAGPTRAFALSKEILARSDDLEAVMALEAQQLRKAFATSDLREGVLAFQQRRKPLFTGQ